MMESNKLKVDHVIQRMEMDDNILFASLVSNKLKMANKVMYGCFPLVH